MHSRVRVTLLLVLLASGLAGCMPQGVWPIEMAATADPVDPISVGKARFRAGDFGLAEASFSKAVEETPANAEAWLGLAAAHDQLGRFDLADKDYGRLEPMLGRSVTFLNNRGYSYLLRGDHVRARRDLEKALSLDPENSSIQANLAQLRGQIR